MRAASFKYDRVQLDRQVFLPKHLRECLSGECWGSSSHCLAVTLLILLLAIHWTVLAPFASSETNPAKILAQVKSEKSAAKRILLLDEALKDQSLKGKTLSGFFFERAMAYKEVGDCFKAIQDLDSAFAHFRGAFPALIEKAECLLQLEQVDEASRILEMHLLSRPNSARGYVLKGIIFEKEGFQTRAEDEYSRALYYDPKFPAALEARARLRLALGKTSEALADSTHWIEIFPRNKEALLLRARIHAKFKNYADALRDYTAAEQIDPNDKRILRDKVELYLKTNQPDSALESLSARPKADGETPEFLVYQARAMTLKKSFSTAEGLLKKAASMDESYAPAFLFLGESRFRERDYDGALEYFNRALGLDPKLLEAYKQRARVFLALGEPARSGSDLAQATRLDPADGEVSLLRGKSNMARFLYEEAAEDFGHAIASLPGDVRPFFYRALAYIRLAEYSAALLDLDAVIKEKPHSPRALTMRGVVWYCLGHNTKALHDFNQSLLIDPDDPVLHNNRGYFLYKTGQYDAAIKDLETALRFKDDYATAQINLECVKNLRNAEPLFQHTSKP